MNSAQFGDFIIFLIFGSAILSGIGFFVTAIGRKNLFALAKRAYYLQIGFTVCAAAFLWYLFFSHDFSIQYVYSYSSSDLPFFYLLSGLWAGQEGTYLLWLLFSSLFGLIILFKGKQYTTWAMFFYTLINLFLLVMMLTLSPFRPLDFAAFEGAGLNELLQDPWMVVHPPVTFVAFAMAGVPFAIALAAMIRRDFSRWLVIALPYVGITVLAFALANVLGGLWAYKTLGWGGYWAWDPVENTSFVPWVISLALIHSMLIEKKTGALRRTNLLMTALIFLLVIYGTFLTRSGVLADFSVHSFVDLGINAVLISFVLLYAILSLAIFLYAARSAAGTEMNYNIYSRDFMLFVGMLLLFTLGIVVMFWSSLPFLTKYLSENPAAAEISTYNSFAFPFAIFISLFLTLGMTGTGPDADPDWLKSRAMLLSAIPLTIATVLYLLGMVTLTIALTIFIYFAVILVYMLKDSLRARLIQSLPVGLFGVIIALLLGVRGIDQLLFIVAAVAAITANLLTMLPRIRRGITHVAAHINHLGYGLMILGILASSAFSRFEKIVLPREETRSALGYNLTYHGISGSLEDKNNEVIITVDDNGNKIDARPRYFYSRRMDGMMKKPFIRRNITYDLYLSPHEIQDLHENSGLMLKKGEIQKVGPFTIHFIGFKMAPHGDQMMMSVGAKLEVKYEDRTETITPLLVSDPGGGQGMISQPIPLIEGTGYEIELTRVFADQGAVSLSIPGLIDSGPPDRLILDVTTKPGINLLWLGTFLMFLGTGLSISRRYSQQS